jgi:hypothetical protein
MGFSINRVEDSLTKGLASGVSETDPLLLVTILNLAI